MKYRIIGPRRVAGIASGGVIDVSHMTDEQVAALVEGGHIAPEKKEPENGKDSTEGSVDNR